MLHKFFMSVFGFLTSIISSFFTATVTVIIQHNKNLIWNYCVKWYMRKKAEYFLKKYTETRTEQSDVVITDHSDSVYAINNVNRGVIYIKRPNKARLDMKDPGKIIISDGSKILDTNLASGKSEEFLDCKYHPLHFFCRDKIDMTDFSKVVCGNDSDGDTIIDLERKGGVNLKLTFAPILKPKKGNFLKKYEEIDNDKITKSYEFSNTKKDVEIKEDMFAIPYQDIAMKR